MESTMHLEHALRPFCNLLMLLSISICSEINYPSLDLKCGCANEGLARTKIDGGSDMLAMSSQWH